MTVFDFLLNIIKKIFKTKEETLTEAKDYTDTAEQSANDYTDSKLNAYLKYIQCASEGITNANVMTQNAVYSGYGLSNAPQAGWTVYLVLKHDNNASYIHQIAFPIGNASKFWIRAYNGASGWTSWNQYNQN